MNTRSVTIISLVFFVFMSSCSSDEKASIFNQKIKQHYSGAYGESINLTKIKAIIFLPREGCQGCISDASSMTIDLLEKREDIAVIFTVVNDLKLLKRQYASFLNNPLVSVDLQGLFKDERVSSIYPQIAYMKNGECHKVEEFGNGSEEFSTLFNSIN